MNQTEFIIALSGSNFSWFSIFVMTVVGLLMIASFGVFVFQWGARVKTIEQLGKARECQRQIDEIAEMSQMLGIAIKHIQQQQQGGFTVFPSIIMDAAWANNEIQRSIAQLARGFGRTAEVEFMIRQHRPRRQINLIARPGL